MLLTSPVDCFKVETVRSLSSRIHDAMFSFIDKFTSDVSLKREIGFLFSEEPHLVSTDLAEALG
jgi:hypothetical protein